MMAVVLAHAAVSLKAFIAESLDRHCGLRCPGLRSSSVGAIAIQPAFAHPIINEWYSHGLIAQCVLGEFYIEGTT